MMMPMAYLILPAGRMTSRQSMARTCRYRKISHDTRDNHSRGGSMSDSVSEDKESHSISVAA